MYVSPCACKGIRSCNLCEPKKDDISNEYLNNTVFIYCDACRQAIRMDIYECNSQCPHYHQTDIGNNDIAFPLDGIYLASDFLTEEEETDLIKSIENDVWISSQSGRSKQDFGIKINFKKQTIKTKYFTGMPMYSKPLIERLQTHRVLADFQSVELCNLDYSSQRGSHIDPHIDDIWIWGERLITINLLSDTILSLIPKENETKKIIYIPLPHRWMVVLYGDARYEYKHAIQRQHIQQRRLAVTFRELTSKNEKFYEENKDLYERIIRIGKRFTGISVGRFEQIVNDVNSGITDKMDVDPLPSISEDQLKDLFESTSQTKISSFQLINPSTYSIVSDNEYILKLLSHSFLSREQLQSILSSCQLSEAILATSTDQFHFIILNKNLLSMKHIGRFLAQWRLATRNLPHPAIKNSFDNQWFTQQYAMIINQKKNSYPFLLSNLFTCQQQISEQQLESGLLWTNNQHSVYLLDLAATFLSNIDSFTDNIREILHGYEEILHGYEEILHGYEEILQLTTDEINLIDTFVRLQLVLHLSNLDTDDEKLLDLLEQLSSSVFFVRNLVR